MKKNSKVISTLLITATLTTLGTTVFAGETNEVIKEKILAGETRYESAIEVSKEGWESSETAVLVNGLALPDALAATPYAKTKHAPILLTEGNKLTDVTKEELIRLNVKNVTIVGGDVVVSKNIEIELQNMGINVERLAGSDRFETSIKVAKKLDAKSVAVVNGLDGRMADAMSIASPAAENKMAIILSDGNNLRNGENFIANNGITNAYVVGGEGVVSKNIVSKLNAKRLGGINRLETNAIVLREFYNENEIKNLYIAKDGSKNEGQLVDALAAGALASKESAPVMLVGSHVSDVQKQFLNEKQIKTVTRVGYGINDLAIEEIYDVLKVVRGRDVTTVKDLQKALETAKKNDLVKFSPKDTITESYKIESNKELTVELNGKHTGTITVDMPNGDIINNGELTYEVIVNDIKDGTFINNGRVKSMNVSDTNGSSILNTDKATIDKIVVNEKAKLSVSGKISEISIEGKDAQLKVHTDSEIEKLQVKEKGEGSLIENAGKIKKAIIDRKAENVKIDNEKGKIDKLEGNKESIICGKENIETITSAGAGGGSGSSGGGSSTTTPSDSEKDIKTAKDRYFETVKKYTDLKDKYTENSWTKFNELVQKETRKVDDKNTTVKIINEAEETIKLEAEKLLKKQEKVMYALTAINTASKEEMGKVLVEKAEILELDLSSYKELTNKEAVNYRLVKKNFVNPEAIQEEINKLVEKVKNEINIKFENNKLSWNEVEGANSYSISILGNEDSTVKDLEKINEIDINNMNLRSGKYDVYVTVKFNDGAKKQSNKKEIEYKKADIQEISNLKFDEKTKMLKWDSIENVENYTVFIYDNVQGSLVDKSGKKLDENNGVCTNENNVHFESIENFDYTFCVEANFEDRKSICSYLERKIVGKPYEEKELLKSPENIKVDNNIITWNKVENAIGYRITLIGKNDFLNEFVTGDILNYEIGEECRLIPGDYIVRIVSIADENSNYGNSENNSKEVIYSKNKKVLQVPNEVKVDEGILTWNKVEYAKEYFIKIENDIESKIISVNNEKISLDLRNKKLPVGVNKISICAWSSECMYIKASDYSDVIEYNVKEDEPIINENLNSKTATSLFEKAFKTIATLFIK